MRFKSGVNPFGIKPELAIALQVIDSVYLSMGRQELVVTSLNDGKHSHASLHYSGYAADLRTRYFNHEQGLAQRVRDEIVKSLGYNGDYDVVLESTHIHIEYQPKYRRA